jgi:ABC-type transporter Mla maintaining outer membrane lipid asymmetry permease subunit MlaE
VFLILWAVVILMSGVLRGFSTEGGAYGVGQWSGFVVFPMLLIWLGRRALIKGLAARRLSHAPSR